MASTTPLRSMISPRLGTMGTTAVRLLSACAARSSWRTTCKNTSRATMRQKAKKTTAPITSARIRKRVASASLLRSSVMRKLHGAIPVKSPAKPAQPRPAPPWNWLCQATGGVPLPQERGKTRSGSGGASSHKGLFWSRSGGRRWGASSTQLASGQSSAASSGARKLHTPGNMPPDAMRSKSSIAWARINKGKTCRDCDGTLNHNRRRWMAMAPNESTV
ncbi:hypothetical protein D3C71_1614810 [compost metagenome]